MAAPLRRSLSTLLSRSSSLALSTSRSRLSPRLLTHLLPFSILSLSKTTSSSPGSDYSPLNNPSPNWSNRPPKETILLDGCDYEHWLIVMEFPTGRAPSEEEMINTYVKTLASVVGSEEEARKKIYSVSTTTYTGFGALISEELSYKVKGLPGVLWVLPDSYLDVPNQDYGGDLYIDGKVFPRPQYRFTERQQTRTRSRPQPNARLTCLDFSMTGLLICKNLQPLRLLGLKKIALQIKKHNTNPSKKYPALLPSSGITTRIFILAISFTFNPSAEPDAVDKRSNKGSTLEELTPRLEPLINGGARTSSGGGSWEAREEKARFRRKPGNAGSLNFLLEDRRLRLRALATTGGADEWRRAAMAGLVAVDRGERLFVRIETDEWRRVAMAGLVERGEIVCVGGSRNM
ncbi:hypothetical protein FCM35_KLT02460 [Carex littledalei]|uniref:MORF/ORRM1/DAG-like MORF domain-containing protein n=1 Tax=Carex littledalei TaxID=544730 RepID=A0A833R3S8_9POAL|nr:hypothetical protein FCM35_KLT02460 [Carex littledalei]